MQTPATDDRTIAHEFVLRFVADCSMSRSGHITQS